MQLLLLIGGIEVAIVQVAIAIHHISSGIASSSDEEYDCFILSPKSRNGLPQALIFFPKRSTRSAINFCCSNISANICFKDSYSISPMTLIKIFQQQFQPDHRDYFQFNLLTPDFIIWQQEQNSLETPSRNIRVCFANKFVFSIGEDMWILEIQLLGFGFGMIKQRDY